MSALEPHLVARLEELVAEVQRVQRVPGVAIGILSGGEPVYLRGFGVTDVEAPAPVDADTVFRAASISKTFTATAVLGLAERGLVALDAPLAVELPGFAPRDPRARAATVAQVLSHTAGLPDFDPLGIADFAPDDAPGAPARFAASLVDLELVGEPGGTYRYSNLGFDLLAALVEHASGEPFEEHLERAVLRPAGLTDATFRRRPPDRAREATGHGVTRAGDLTPLRRDLFHGRHMGCGTLTVSARELLRWVAVHVDGGALPSGERLLSPAMHARMLAPVVATGRPDGARAALGWTARPFRGGCVAGHGGWDPGFRAGMSFDPARRVGVVVLDNFHWAATLELTNAALAVALGEEPDPVFSLLPALAGDHQLDGRTVRVDFDAKAPCLVDRGERRRLIRMAPAALLAADPGGREATQIDASGARTLRFG